MVSEINTVKENTMTSIIFWLVVGTFIGWNLPQPAFAKYLQGKAIALLILLKLKVLDLLKFKSKPV